MHDDVWFRWPAAGNMQVTPLPSGGCNIKFVFPDRCVVCSIGKGRIIHSRSIPTKRIAQQYEIIIRHDNDFESSYSIVDQTPNPTAGGAGRFMMLGTAVEHGSKLYEVRNGGVLHLQLFHAGKLVDPRKYIRTDYGAGMDDLHHPPEV